MYKFKYVNICVLKVKRYYLGYLNYCISIEISQYRDF